MRTLLTLAILAIAVPALAGDMPWSYHSGGKHSTSRSYRSSVPPGIVGGRSVSPSSRYDYGRRSYGRRGYGRGDTIIIIQPDRGSYGRRWR